jgi:nucleotide-binding universal stress UspA family protein
MAAYKKIIVGTDGSATSMRAVERAGALAGDSGAELVVVTAYEPAGKEEVRAAADQLKEDAYQVIGSAPAERVAREAADRARAAGSTKVTVLALQGPPVDVLDQAVADQGADLLVVGNVGLNTIAGRLLGSVPANVSRRAKTDVLIVHTTP